MDPRRGRLESPRVGKLVRAIVRGYCEWPGLFALALAGMAYQVGFNLFIPLMTRHVFDDVLPAGDRRGLALVAMALGAAVLLRVVAAFVQERSMGRLTARAMAARRGRMFAALQGQSASYHARTPAAETLSRFSSDLALVENATVRQLPRALFNALNVVGCTVLMLLLDLRLAGLIGVILVVAFVAPRPLGARAARRNAVRRGAETRLLGAVHESIALQSVIRTFGLERWVGAAYDTTLAAFRESAARSTIASGYVEMFATLAFAVVQVLVLCIGAWLVLAGHLTIGQLIAFTAIVGTVSGSMFGLSSMMPPLIESASGFARIATLRAPDDRSDERPLPAVHGDVRFEGVTFSYTGERADLRDVSLEVPAGTRAAFVGPSGSGKSTALALIMRANTPNAGRVLIDGHDLSAVSAASLYGQMAVVAQDSLLFDTSVRENIRVGRLDASDAEVEEAARKAEIHEPILAMPRGYDTVVGERGGNLSGGQRQRIAIARAILRAPQLLLLDEATSALDPSTEEAVSQTLDRVGQGRTTIAVTHRLVTVQAYERIFVMQDGQLVQTGSHRELVERDGLYRQLWSKQHAVSVSPSGQASLDPGLLASVSVLASLDDDARRDLAAQFVTMACDANHELFRVGDPGDAFYVIAHGQVAIEVPLTDRTVEHVLSEGDGFGEIALLSPVARTATARTRTPCTLLVLRRAAFTAMTERHPAVAAELRAKAAAHLSADQTGARAAAPVAQK